MSHRSRSAHPLDNLPESGPPRPPSSLNEPGSAGGTRASPATCSSGTGPEGAPLRPQRSLLTELCVVVPAFNEEHSVRDVVESLRHELPGSHVLIVSDGSTDGTADVALAAGATVLCLPVNIGIGGAVQAGYRYAVRRGFRYVMQVDGDGQHDVTDALRLLEPVLAGKADLTLGSRWIGPGDYVASTSRRLGMRILALLVRCRTGQVFTDTTSGYRALGPQAVSLFATSYPTDFPEVESIVHAKRQGLTVLEVPVKMKPREHGRSSIAGLRSAYYMARVAFALLVGGPGWARRS